MPEDSDLVAQAKQAYHFAMEHLLYEQAVFYAERIQAEAPCEEHAYLFALALFHNKEVGRAFQQLQQAQGDSGRYLRAQCAMALQKFEDAEHALTTAPRVPKGAAGFFLLGQVKEKLLKRDQAISCYTNCLAQSPSMWCAYDRLAALVPGTSRQAQGSAEFAHAHLAEEKLAQDPVVGGKKRKPKRREEDLSLAQLLQTFGAAVHALRVYDVQEALGFLKQLPRRHLDLGLGLELLGRAHFEAGDHRLAEQAYSQLRRQEPRRVAGLEYYSSCLWYLSKPLELAQLSHTLVLAQGDRLQPQVWCAVGTCFSLQREHDTAVKFFRRAIQVQPLFAYAYALCAHEYVAQEKFDRAIQLYEHALSIDPRSYNAWWGLGHVYHRQEEHSRSLYHFQKALQINPSNSVLLGHVGWAWQAMDDPHKALEMFTKAAQLQPKNSVAVLEQARILLQLNRDHEALELLQHLLARNPKEACVRFEVGKACMKVGDVKKAFEHFNYSLDLLGDSKEHHLIKSYLAQLQAVPAEGSSTPGRRRRGRKSSPSDPRTPPRRRGAPRRSSSPARPLIQLSSGEMVHVHSDLLTAFPDRPEEWRSMMELRQGFQTPE